MSGSVPNLELNFDEELDVYGQTGPSLTSASFPNSYSHGHEAKVNNNAIAQEATLLA